MPSPGPISITVRLDTSPSASTMRRADAVVDQKVLAQFGLVCGSVFQSAGLVVVLGTLTLFPCDG